jgi:sulfite exporter TauE/SafE
VTYAALGASAGALGSAVNLAGTHAGVVDSAGLVAGVLVLGAGLRGLLVARGVNVPVLGTATGIQSWIRRRLVGSTREPLLRAGVVGVSTALLPCGWLYAFVFAAAGTGTPLGGGAVLFAFWLGTLPALLGVGAAVRRLDAALGRHAALFSAVVLVALGLGTIMHRVNIPAAALSQLDAAAARAGETEELPCHSGGTP